MRRTLLTIVWLAVLLHTSGVRAQDSPGPFLDSNATKLSNLDPLLQKALAFVSNPPSSALLAGALEELQSLIEIEESSPGCTASGSMSCQWIAGILIVTDGSLTEAMLEATAPGLAVRSGPLTSEPGIEVFTADIPLSIGTSQSLQPLSQLAALSGIGVRRIDASYAVFPELDVSTQDLLVPVGPNMVRAGMGSDFINLAGFTGQATNIGVVDTGIDYYHDDFLDNVATTRVLKIWDQGLKPIAGENSPAGFGYGVEYDQLDIIADIAALPLRHTIVRSQDTVGHGTHVAGIAAGDGSSSGLAAQYAGVAPEADLIVVKTTGFHTQMIEAVKYIYGVAAAQPNPAAAVNISMGNNLGPHDGYSSYSRGLAALLGPGKILVMSAGNSGGEAIHAENDGNALVANGAFIDIPVAVAAGARSFTVEIYTDNRTRVSLELRSPGGAPLTRRVRPPGVADAAANDVGVANRQWTIGVNVMIVSITNNEIGFGADRTDRRLTVNVSRSTNLDVVTAGNWVLRLHPLNVNPFGNGLFDAYIASSPRANPSVALFGALAVNDEKSNDGPSHWSILAVGSHKSTKAFPNGNISTFSNPGPSRTPTAKGGRTKPDLVAPGEQIESTRSSDCPVANCPAGTDAFHTIFQGTSMAAPHVTGCAAIMLQQRNNLTPAAARILLTTRGRWTDAQTGVVPNNTWGWGKLVCSDNMIGIPAVTDVVDLPVRRSLRAWPNPFSKTTSIAWLGERELASKGFQIYDVAGRRVRELEIAVADRMATWDGLDAHGRRVAPGVYFARRIGGPASESVRVVVMR